MIYVFVDTNLWVRFISQGRPGCELVHFEELKRLVENGSVNLVLPEIVELELEKQWRDFKETVKEKFLALSGELDKLLKGVWSEIEDLRTTLPASLMEKRDHKINAAESHYKQIQDLFNCAKITKLPLTPELLFAGRKRIIAGRMPRPKNDAHSDACNLESLLVFFSSCGDKTPQLYFCSGDKKDFRLETETGATLHPLAKEGLPPAQFFVDLNEMIAFHKTNAPIQDPSPVDVEKALERILERRFHRSRYRCTHGGCLQPMWIISQYCKDHFEEHHKLSDQETVQLVKLLEHVLKTLTYKERELLKLRTGYGDGFIYTQEQCSKIFKMSRDSVRRIEEKARRKMEHPIRSRQLEKFLRTD